MVLAEFCDKHGKQTVSGSWSGRNSRAGPSRSSTSRLKEPVTIRLFATLSIWTSWTAACFELTISCAGFGCPGLHLQKALKSPPPTYSVISDIATGIAISPCSSPHSSRLHNYSIELNRPRSNCTGSCSQSQPCSPVLCCGQACPPSAPPPFSSLQQPSRRLLLFDPQDGA